jgi:DNA-binding response OmpR family regulator
VEHRATGLRAGPDDYLTTPISLEELVARVESLIRRGYGQRSPVVRLGNLELNTTSRTLARDGEPVSLTPREYRLLELLALRRGEVLSRADIEEHLYGEEMEVFSNVVESTISSLRKKIDPSGSEPLIQTRRGMGYVLEA